MTNKTTPKDTTSAFAHPEFRAASMPLEGVHDRLSLRDHVVDVEIGAFQAERDMTQRVSFDVVVEVAAPEADLEDDVDRILSYDRLTWAIEAELAAQRLNLLETLAEGIADRILLEPQALRVFVRIQKLDKGNGKLGVEVVRVPSDAKQAANQKNSNKTNPTVVFINEQARKDAGLQGFLTDLKANPLVLALDRPESRPATDDMAAQRQIDLLAIEQSAWQLVATLEAVSVAATRTELDWAMKTGQTCIWAPAKLVNDAVEAPEGSAGELAIWFAQEWGADKIIDVGGTLPETDTIEVQTVTLAHSAS
ncbi:dihydroneopterin aldolase [Cognatishimia sp.]|uniref:dihydroneopterin aldolase n=1 Tax=Cognatishimia sp. TaxID=2211648 RepID=UPI003BACC188